MTCITVNIRSRILKPTSPAISGAGVKRWMPLRIAGYAIIRTGLDGKCIHEQTLADMAENEAAIIKRADIQYAVPLICQINLVEDQKTWTGSTARDSNNE